MLLIGKAVGKVVELALGYVADKLVSLVERAVQKEPRAPSEAPQPLTFKDVEHQRAQMNASIEASKRLEAERAGKAHVDRTAPTARPGKSGKLPS